MGFADFLILSNWFGNRVPVVGCCGDYDESGILDFSDFLALSANYGAVPLSVETVPEPSSLAYLTMSMMAVGMRIVRSRERKKTLTATVSHRPGPCGTSRFFLGSSSATGKIT